MKRSPIGGLLIGLLVALAAMGIAAGSTSPAMSALPADTPSVATLPEPSTALPAAATRPQTPTPSATPVPPTPSQTPSHTPPTSSPSPTPSPGSSEVLPLNTEQIIGYSVEGRPISAHRIGDGPIKIALIGDIHGEFEANTHVLAQQLLEHFRAHPQEVPTATSLWIIPTMNPDGLATGHRWNANDVDLNRNADTDLDGCAGNDWSPDTVGLEGPYPGAGGAYPFSEPEARATRDFLDDAWIAVFYHSAAEAIFIDTCQRHAPTARLAEVLSDGSGYPVPEEGWMGYPITGDFGDYLAGEGVAAVTLELIDHEDPEFERNLEGVRALLAAAAEIVSAEVTGSGATYHWLDKKSTGEWSYAENSFIHPIAMEVFGDTAYLLDAGRVLALDLTQPAEPRQILAPDDEIDGVRVLEPLDLAVDGSSLLSLDRAGDVYRYEPAANNWTIERYDRPVRDSYDHYFVALAGSEAANYLLETTHEQVWRFVDGKTGAAWVKLPQSRDVDVSASSNGVYVLTRKMNGPQGAVLRYKDASPAGSFAPNIELMHPRQVVATDTTVYVLDRAGRRLLALDPASGALLALYQFPDRREVSAVWADPSRDRLILAGRDTLYFYGEPEREAYVEGGALLDGPQPHDPVLLESLRGLSMPIEGATVTKRDFQMPGAPRHYRLGVHEGIDFYGHTVGVPVNRQTTVQAVDAGVVVRALVDYQSVTAAEADAWYAQSHRLGYTPPEVLDGYRGRQAWIDHGNSFLSRYAHLGGIEPGIVEGEAVVTGQAIAKVGNSGTPGSLNSETYDVHLHLELWVGDHFVGQFLRPIEAREWLERILR
ncbi:MAG TPA: M14 family zinc carboxypeptidase [Anaerolineae bacterium]|nr:M14 family zinc carboxypeptidase [Anaerolineae bacterium]